MILFLAGLQNINPELYEVAAIDGAGPWQNFRKITLPLLRPTTLYVVITSIIGGFQVFEAVYILFAGSEGMGGVLDSGLTVVPYLYDSGFRLFQMGYASAIAWILFAIIFVLTLINLRVGRANEAY
jgi:multiple sugar transport system permease protein